MKKLLIVLLIAFVGIVVSGCGNTEEKKADAKKKEKSASTAKASRRSKPKIKDKASTDKKDKINMKVKVISLALHTNENLRKNASEVIKEINAGEHPYKDKNIPSLWVWLFDTDLKIIAHPNSRIVGKVRKGVPDVKGKMYRDEILKGALKNGSGWVEYHYPKPGRRGYFKKSCYYVLSKASNGKKYIVCSAYYLD